MKWNFNNNGMLIGFVAKVSPPMILNSVNLFWLWSSTNGSTKLGGQH